MEECEREFIEILAKAINESKTYNETLSMDSYGELLSAFLDMAERKLRAATILKGDSAIALEEVIDYAACAKVLVREGIKPINITRLVQYPDPCAFVVNNGDFDDDTFLAELIRRTSKVKTAIGISECQAATNTLEGAVKLIETMKNLPHYWVLKKTKRKYLYNKFIREYVPVQLYWHNDGWTGGLEFADLFGVEEVRYAAELGPKELRTSLLRSDAEWEQVC